MQYRQFPKIGQPVSTLGYGCMRLPLIRKSDDVHGELVEEPLIDEQRTIALIRRAIDAGVNYVDTAYNYHAQRSELVVGKALQGGYRERTLLATKLPCWLVKETADFDRLLDEQLAKLGTDHIDFYLLHALNRGVWEKVKSLGVLAFLDRAVADGRIRFPSFSFHDAPEIFTGIVDAYDWAMCQIQLNYMNQDYQAGTAGLRRAAERGIPVVIMEPLLGGKLAQVPPAEIAAIWDSAPVKRSPAEWAFRWVADFPEVLTVLSGMTTEAQLEENLRIFADARPNSLTAEERALYPQVRDIFQKRTAVNCTGCRYCMPCPQKVAIPLVFDLHNTLSVYGTTEGEFEPYETLAHIERDASRCIACGQCERKCPQQLPIIEKLKQAHAALTAAMPRQPA